MTLTELYQHICWNEANYSMIEDKLIDIQNECPIAWRDANLDVVLHAVAIGKLNAREVRRSIKLQARDILED
jgi:hypothetical protein